MSDEDSGLLLERPVSDDYIGMVPESETVRAVSGRRKSLISEFVRYAEVPGSIPGFPI